MSMLLSCLGIFAITLMTMGGVVSILMMLDLLYGTVKKFLTGNFTSVHPKTVFIPSVICGLLSWPVLYATGSLYADSFPINFSPPPPPPAIERIDLDSNLTADYRMQNPEIEHIDFEE